MTRSPCAWKVPADAGAMVAAQQSRAPIRGIQPAQDNRGRLLHAREIELTTGRASSFRDWNCWLIFFIVFSSLRSLQGSRSTLYIPPTGEATGDSHRSEKLSGCTA